MIDKKHQEKFKSVWNKGDYRRGSTAERMLPLLLDVIPEEATINDYGCGTGRMEVEINKIRPQQSILMIDITEEALEKEAINLLVSSTARVFFKEMDISDLGIIRKAHWGICINTLMTVQPEKLDKILLEIKRTCENLIVEMYDLSDKRLGMEMTTVKKNKIEWAEKLMEYWSSVSFEQSKESKNRYIFICKDVSVRGEEDEEAIN